MNVGEWTLFQELAIISHTYLLFVLFFLQLENIYRIILLCSFRNSYVHPLTTQPYDAFPTTYAIYSDTIFSLLTLAYIEATE